MPDRESAWVVKKATMQAYMFAQGKSQDDVAEAVAFVDAEHNRRLEAIDTITQWWSDGLGTPFPDSLREIMRAWAYDEIKDSEFTPKLSAEVKRLQEEQKASASPVRPGKRKETAKLPADERRRRKRMVEAMLSMAREARKPVTVRMRRILESWERGEIGETEMGARLLLEDLRPTGT